VAGLHVMVNTGSIEILMAFEL